MNTDLRDTYNQFKAIVDSEFVSLLHERIDHQIVLLQQIKSTQKEMLRAKYQPEQLKEALLKAYTYKSQLLELVEKDFRPEAEPNFEVDFINYNTAADAQLEALDEIKRLPEGEDRYHKLPSDSHFLGIGKWWKRIFFKISKWPEKTKNAFRSLFKKEKKPLRPWHHKVKFKNLTEFYLKEKLTFELLDLYKQVYKGLIDSAKVCWSIDVQIDKEFQAYLHQDEVYDLNVDTLAQIADEIERLEGLKQDITERAAEIYEQIFEQYTETYVKAGTIEVSNSRFSKGKIKKQHKAASNHYKQMRTGWNNTLLVLADDWEIDLELYTIIYAALEVYHNTLKAFEVRLNKIVDSKLTEIKALLEQTRQKLTSEDDLDLRLLLEKELTHLRAVLTPQLLPETNNLILAQEFPALVNNVESSIDRLIKSISVKRTVMKGVSYDQPIKTSSLNFVSPYELINFESWPQFQKTLKTVKLGILDKINQVQNNVNDIGQIAEFNIESAISLFESEDQANDPVRIATEGLDRTIDKVKDIHLGLEGLVTTVKEELHAGIEKFNDSLVKFTNNENIYDIRVRIAKGKAIEKSERFKEQLTHNIRNFLPTVAMHGRTAYHRLSNMVLEASKRIGIAGQQKVISTELADFLAETEKSIDQLPFVYQRLFRTEPLTDLNFFEGRSVELVQLNNAYNNWTRGRFASVAIVGEKGSGVTTLLNFFLKDLVTSSAVHRFAVKDHIDSNKGLLNFFAKNFDHEFGSLDELVTFLNSRKRVLVVENLQKLYLKKVNGFRAIRLLTELISLTSNSTFWVTGSTKYAWEYLDKSIQLSDHFSYYVPLTEFDDSAIVNMINKRHRVSGYNIQFEPAPSELNQKKFKKLNEPEKQLMLRNRYFGNLNKIAKSNVSLALIYWLRSTKQIQGNTIVIGSLKDIDFSFMNNLPATKVHVLANLLFHDGMTEPEFCQVTGYANGKSRSVLQPMFEDGVIVLNDGVYHINPLLYRQTIIMLKMKNIIH